MKSKEFILSEHLDKITILPHCLLCQGHLDDKEENRGIIEFQDGWFWICSKCKKVVGATFDQTQSEPWWDTVIPPYYAKSRGWWLKWFEREYHMKFN